MRRLPVAAAAALEAGQERLAHLWLLLRARPRLLALLAGGSAVLLLGVFAALRVLAYGAAPSDRSVAEPRYLAVCGACGWRATFAEHPTHNLDQRGALRCTQCGAYQVSWYRRGGQTAPPGGWSTAATPSIAASQDLTEAGP